MKRVVVLLLFMFIAIFTYGQTDVTKKIDERKHKRKKRKLSR